MVYIRSLGFLWLFFIFSSVRVLAQSDTPIEIVQESVAKIRSIFRDSISNKNKEDALKRILVPHFDFDAMTMSSLGTNWRKLSPEQKLEVVRRFRAGLIHKYVKVAEYIAWADDVEFVLNKEDGTHHTVQTELIYDQNETYSVDYKFHLVKGVWKMYDVRFNGYSQVNYFRGQFAKKLVNKEPRRIFDIVINFIKKILPGI